jgi:hypothetical protein
MYIDHYLFKAEAVRLVGQKHSRLRTWAFLIFGVISWVSAVLFCFVLEIVDVYFSVLIIYRNQISAFLNKHIFSALAAWFYRTWDVALAYVFPSAWVAKIYRPFDIAFEALSDLQLSVTSAVGITCPGSTAAIRLMDNLLILGIAIIVIESDFAVFKALTYGPLARKNLTMISHPVFMQWYLHRHGDTKFTRLCYGLKVWAGYMADKLLAIDVFTKSLLYLLTLVAFRSYRYNEIHETLNNGETASCDNIDGWIGVDSDILIATSVAATLMVAPAVYSVSKVLVPGIPKGMAVKVSDVVVSYYENGEEDMKHFEETDPAVITSPIYDKEDRNSGDKDNGGEEGVEMGDVGKPSSLEKGTGIGGGESSGDDEGDDQFPSKDEIPVEETQIRNRSVSKHSYGLKGQRNEIASTKEVTSSKFLSHNFLRIGSFFAPDLWFAAMTDAGMQIIKSTIPRSVNPISPTILSSQTHEVREMRRTVGLRRENRRELHKIIQSERERAVYRTRRSIEAKAALIGMSSSGVKPTSPISWKSKRQSKMLVSPITQKQDQQENPLAGASNDDDDNDNDEDQFMRSSFYKDYKERLRAADLDREGRESVVEIHPAWLARYGYYEDDERSSISQTNNSHFYHCSRRETELDEEVGGSGCCGSRRVRNGRSPDEDEIAPLLQHEELSVHALKLSSTTSALLSRSVLCHPLSFRYEVDRDTGKVTKKMPKTVNLGNDESGVQSPMHNAASASASASAVAPPAPVVGAVEPAVTTETHIKSIMKQDKELRAPVTPITLNALEDPLKMYFRLNTATMDTNESELIGSNNVVIEDTGLYYCSRVMNDTKVWTRVPLDVPDAGCDYVVFAIRRATGDVEFADCYSLSLNAREDARWRKYKKATDHRRCIKGSDEMVEDLASFNSDYVVCVASNGWSWGMGREKVPTSGNFQAHTGNSGRRTEVDLSNPDDDLDSDQTALDEGGEEEDDGIHFYESIDQTCTKVEEALRQLGGSAVRVERSVRSVSQYYSEQPPSLVKKEKKGVMRRLTTMVGFSAEEVKTRHDSLDPYLLMAIPGRGENSGFEIIKTGLGSTPPSMKLADGDCSAKDVYSMDQICLSAMSGDRHRIDVIFEVSGATDVIRQNRACDSDTNRSGSGFVKKTTGSCLDGFDLFPDSSTSCDTYFEETFSEREVSLEGFWVMDTRDTFKDSGTVALKHSDTGRCYSKGPPQDVSILRALRTSVFSRRSYLFSNFWNRSRIEQRVWKRFRVDRMPTYLALCVAEYEELAVKGRIWIQTSGCSCLGQEGLARWHDLLIHLWEVFSLLLVLVLLGHIFTEVGRSAYKIMLRKYFLFFFCVCPGFWTDECVMMMNLPQRVDDYSLKWGGYQVHRAAQDVVKRRQDVRKARGFAELEESWKLNLLSEKSVHEICATELDARVRKQIEHTRAIEEGAEVPEDIRLEHEAEKQLSGQINKLFGYDYAGCISSMISTRATILQVIPWLAPVTVFVSQMARFPIFVFSPFLEYNLLTLLPYKTPYKSCRAWQQLLLDISMELRDKEIRSTTWSLPNPIGVSYDDGSLEPVPEWERDTIRAHNIKMESKLKGVHNSPRPKVQTWEVALAGTLSLMDSRLIQFLYNLYKFTLVMGVSFFYDEFTTPHVSIITAAVLIPVASIFALSSPLLIGRLMGITDADLVLALPLFKCCGLKATDITGTDNEQNNSEDVTAAGNAADKDDGGNPFGNKDAEAAEDVGEVKYKGDKADDESGGGAGAYAGAYAGAGADADADADADSASAPEGESRAASSTAS